MPRLLRRAAVLGATAHIASNRGQAKAEAAYEQQAAADAAYQQQAAAAPPPAPMAPAEPTAAPADPYAELMKMKQLLDAGVLTQAEFDAQKQKLLGA